jgi:hypothetical protein
VEIVTDAAQFTGKEYINGIFLAVWTVFCFCPYVADVAGDDNGDADGEAEGDGGAQHVQVSREQAPSTLLALSITCTHTPLDLTGNMKLGKKNTIKVPQA